MKKPESKFHLIIDTCCDLPPEMVQDDNVTIIPFNYILDHGTYTDDMFSEISAHEFYEKMRKGAEPTTSQLSLDMLTKIFTDAAQLDKPTIYLSFSSGLSSSYDTSLMIRGQVMCEYPNADITIIDTKLGSGAEGLFVLKAISLMNSCMVNYHDLSRERD